MAPITKDTTMCISIAERPSSFGTLMFNSLFAHFGMDWLYKAFKVERANLNGAIDGVRALGVRGCGVSMPHKMEVARLLDSLDPAAKRIGAVNTIVNDNGRLTGYNTDYSGAKRALSENFNPKGKSALLLGSGGAARAVATALQDLGAREISVCGRTQEKTSAFAKEFNLKEIPFASLASAKADIFFNATPVGMAPNAGECPLPSGSISNFSAIADVVVNPLETKLIASARAGGKVAIPGWRMAMYQGAEQFRLYTGREAPIDFMEGVYAKM